MKQNILFHYILSSNRPTQQPIFLPITLDTSLLQEIKP